MSSQSMKDGSIRGWTGFLQVMANERRLPQYSERTTPANHRFMPSFTLLLPTLFGIAKAKTVGKRVENLIIVSAQYNLFTR